MRVNISSFFGCLFLVAIIAFTENATWAVANDDAVLEKAVPDSGGDLETAKAEAITRLEATTEYKSAIAEMEATRKLLETARARGSAQEKLDTSSKFNKARATVDQMTADAIKNDKAIKIILNQQKQIESLRDQVAKLTQEIAAIKLKEQRDAGANNGGPAVPNPANPNVVDALKKGLIVVGMTREEMDAVLKKRGVTSYGGDKQSERLIDGKSIKTEIINPNPDAKNYGIIPTEIELENDVVVRVEGLHL